ncbi:glycoside hydrolase family 114 protein [Mycena rebaudengoi]|nr:glycoside hydrolase family 114 protein [Mycena rebaudengoi]
MLSTAFILTVFSVARLSLGAYTSRAAVTLFDPSGDFDYQIGGDFKPDSTVKTVSRDFEGGKAEPGLYNICYVNVFQSQPGTAKKWWEDNASNLLLKENGQLLLDKKWDEYIFDTSTAANREALAKIVEPWINTCVSKGFNAIEPDNLDTFDRYGAHLTKENNLAFARLLSDYAHSKGLAFAQKNTALLVNADKVAGGFDFAIAEECGNFKECSAYTSLYGNFVLEIEYSDNENGQAVYDQACKDLGSKIPITYRDRDVVPPTGKGYVNLHC